MVSISLNSFLIAPPYLGGLLFCLFSIKFYLVCSFCSMGFAIAHSPYGCLMVFCLLHNVFLSTSILYISLLSLSFLNSAIILPLFTHYCFQIVICSLQPLCVINIIYLSLFVIILNKRLTITFPLFYLVI